MTALAKVEGPSLTEQQARFVEAMLEGHEPSKAVKLAGYGEKATANIVLASEAVQRALDMGCERELRKLLPLAIKRLKTLVSSDKTPSATALNAAKLIVERCDDSDSQDGSKPLAEMSLEELESLIRQKEAALKDVTPGNGVHREGSQLPAPSKD